MAIQGASLIIDRDGTVESFPLHDVTEEGLSKAQHALIDAQKTLRIIGDLILQGVVPPPPEDPADPRTGNLRVELRSDHGLGQVMFSYVADHMSTALRDWVAGFYRRAGAAF